MEKKQVEDACYTREFGLEKAVEMEMNRFRAYKNDYLNNHDRLAKDLLKDHALDELKHKYTLEKAVFEETVLLHDTGYSEGPTYNLNLPTIEKPLSESADAVDVIRYAIQDEKRTVVYYRTMVEQCKGAPMAAIFKQVARDEEDHLARLERLYEDGYMPGK